MVAMFLYNYSRLYERCRLCDSDCSIYPTLGYHGYFVVTSYLVTHGSALHVENWCVK